MSLIDLINDGKAPGSITIIFKNAIILGNNKNITVFQNHHKYIFFSEKQPINAYPFFNINLSYKLAPLCNVMRSCFVLFLSVIIKSKNKF